MTAYEYIIWVNDNALRRRFVGYIVRGVWQRKHKSVSDLWLYLDLEFVVLRAIYWYVVYTKMIMLLPCAKSTHKTEATVCEFLLFCLSYIIANKVTKKKFVKWFETDFRSFWPTWTISYVLTLYDWTHFFFIFFFLNT